MANFAQKSPFIPLNKPTSINDERMPKQVVSTAPTRVIITILFTLNRFNSQKIKQTTFQ